MTLEQMREEREKLRLASIAKLDLAESDGRELTDDERGEVDGMIVDMDRLDDDIKRGDRLVAATATAKAAQARISTPDPITEPQASDPPTEPATRPVVVAARHGVLKAFKGQDFERQAFRCGQWIKAINGNTTATRWCHENGVSIRRVNDDETRAMGETINSAGGFTVPTEFSAAVIDIKEEYGVFRRNARKWDMVRDSIKIPRSTSAGLTVEALGENPTSDITESDASFDEVELNIKNWATNTRVSNDLLADSAINVADYLADRMGFAYALKEDQAAFTGDGSVTYQGILGIADKFEANTSFRGFINAATAANDTIPEMDLADFIPVLGGVIPAFWSRSKWYMSSAMWARVETLLANAGGNTIATVQAGTTGRVFMGFPVELTQVMPSNLTTDYTNLVMAIFGDLSSSSSLGDRSAMTLMVDPFTYQGRNQTRFTSISRWDIVNHDIGSATDLGPIAVLAGGTG